MQIVCLHLLDKLWVFPSNENEMENRDYENKRTREKERIYI